VAKLKDKKIPYEVGERGTIKVPSAQAQEVKLLMAAEGFPQKGGTAGFELFSQPHFGLTEFAEKVNFHRALEGEISRSISRLDAVDTARVHLVIPQPSLFAKDQKDPTASIVIGLKPGRRLDAMQVQAITQLVSSSVEGLKPQNVNVVDSNGNVFTERTATNDSTRQTSMRAEVQRTLETRIENDVRSMLGRVVGSDKVLVRVSADLDWDQYEANTETFSPQQKAPQIRSQRQVTESSSTGGADAGVPGTSSNVPGYAGSDGRGAGGQSERRDVTTNYELSKTVEKIARAPGGVKRLSVAVALDSEALADATQADAVSKLVATAAGLDTNRGDVVTLTSLPFAPSPEKKIAEVAEAARQTEYTMSLARLAALVVGPVLIVGLILLTLRRGRPRRGSLPSIREIQDYPAALDRRERRALKDGKSAELPPARVDDPEQVRITQELTTMANSDPAAVAQLVRSWLQEDRRSI
ncbi:MAG: flagellar M-ring protein FliF, partial [Chloroflexi bacterium]|nr:flagellar M-ring protein FliF [Chloroflexota bacterium]